MRKSQEDLSVLQQGWLCPLRIQGTPIRTSCRVRTKRQAAQPDAISVAAELNSGIMTENKKGQAPLASWMARGAHPDSRKWGLDDQIGRAERGARTKPGAPGLALVTSRPQPEEHTPERTTIFGFGVWGRCHKVGPALQSPACA